MSLSFAFASPVALTFAFPLTLAATAPRGRSVHAQASVAALPGGAVGVSPAEPTRSAVIVFPVRGAADAAALFARLAWRTVVRSRALGPATLPLFVASQALRSLGARRQGHAQEQGQEQSHSVG